MRDFSDDLGWGVRGLLEFCGLNLLFCHVGAVEGAAEERVSPELADR